MAMLVTGGAGFIGSHFVRYALAKETRKVVVLDKLTYCGNLTNLDGVLGDDKLAFVRGDIADTQLVVSLLRQYNINTVVHFAAESHVDRSINAPDIFTETNMMGTYNLLKAVKKVWLGGSESKSASESETGGKHHFHYVSTDEVYGALSFEQSPTTELAAFLPNSPYSASKAAADHLVRSFHQTYGLVTTVSHCCNNYGPHQFPEKLIPLIIVNFLQNKPLPVYGNGLQTRDWLYVEDCVRGIYDVVKLGQAGERYNIGASNEWANIDIVKLICGLIEEAFAGDDTLASRFPKARAAIAGGTELLITYVKDRPGHDRRYAIDASKISTELGYEPTESFETGMRKTVRWYLENEAWWRGVIDVS